ncbi:MAG TPA: UDP-N-acetylmuramoyl-tripeptide--D-alanyl-D-alanine ligase [Acetobacteraceae bacterium]|jgi:UDP-N-acetylmuramoyl-tripeptide--D-alanyl-D-alanine ligase|nr:UDP-N-acetylmuramoyl-tripeptide--D-alanyl-D-alanine ligase [Acetobacteraceae bacterium]
MTALWTPHDLVEATGGAMDTPFAADDVSIDTRTLAGGDLFVALHGDNGDGHAFVADAMAKSAAGAMVHRDVPDSSRLLLVDDTLAGLHRLGGFARMRFGGRLIAVTGSVGKTTTKEMLRAILAAFGQTHAAVASYNNHWGLPLTLARLPPGAAFCVAEIGMNHPGEIAPLANLARPHVAVITAVEKAHIGYLGSIEAIADEKAQLLRGLEPGGVAVLPADSPLLPRLRAAAGKARIVTFGAAAGADARLTAIASDADGSDVAAEVRGRAIRFRLNAPGRHMAINALAAIAGAIELTMCPPEVASRIARTLEDFAPVAGRGVRRLIQVPGGTALLLDESYNGNPASIRAALAVLRLQPAPRRIAVLGDMLELGDAAREEHRALGADVAAAADQLFACGPLMAELFAAVPESMRTAHAADAASLAPLLARAVSPGDAILVKGSLGSRMKLVINALEQHAEAA